MRVSLVSSCTNRKKVSPPPSLQARNLPVASLEKLAAEWTRRVEAATDRKKARDLYAGRAFTEALSTAETIQGRCHIVSAGLGLIALDDTAPAYSLTVAGSDGDNVLSRVDGEDGGAKGWWQALGAAQERSNPLTQLIESDRSGLFVLALPSSYILLVQDDLARLSAAAIERLRIIGLPSLLPSIPQSVRAAFVVYDERFEGVGDGKSGTRSDFPQRAARHFVTSVLTGAETENAEQHSARVAKFLAQFARPSIPTRERYTDDMLKDVIRDLWSEAEGRVTNGLRLLRRERKIACEQSRFKRLFWEVAAEKSAGR